MTQHTLVLWREIQLYQVSNRRFLALCKFLQFLPVLLISQGSKLQPPVPVTQPTPTHTRLNFSVCTDKSEPYHSFAWLYYMLCQETSRTRHRPQIWPPGNSFNPTPLASIPVACRARCKPPGSWVHYAGSSHTDENVQQNCNSFWIKYLI